MQSGIMPPRKMILRGPFVPTLEFTNSGAVKPERTAPICVWSLSDMDALVHHFPSDYRSYLFRGLYFGFFTTWDEDSFNPAINPHSPDDALSFGTDGAIQI
jgi:hypothetical protein